MREVEREREREREWLGRNGKRKGWRESGGIETERKNET